MHVLFLVAQLCLTLVILWAAALQTPVFMGFPREKYRSRLPFPPPRDISDPGIEPASPVSPALPVNSSPTEPLGKSKVLFYKS